MAEVVRPEIVVVDIVVEGQTEAESMTGSKHSAEVGEVETMAEAEAEADPEAAEVLGCMVVKIVQAKVVTGIPVALKMPVGMELLSMTVTVVVPCLPLNSRC
jgi:hypothetical protein